MSDQGPDRDLYRSPAADVSVAGEFDPLRLPAGSGVDWWTQAWDYFKRDPLMWIVILVVWMIAAIVISFIPLIGSIAISIVQPIITAGFLVALAAQHRGESIAFDHIFAPFRGAAVGQLVLLGLIYMGAFLVVGLLAGVIVAIAGFSLMSGADSAVPFGMIAVGILIGAGLIVPVVMAYWFAPALVLFEGLPVMRAIQLSFQACLRNVVPFLVYGLIGMVVMLVAAIPFGLGLLVAMPVGIATMYTAYRDIFDLAPDDDGFGIDAIEETMAPSDTGA